jgi:hypothetical protein
MAKLNYKVQLVAPGGPFDIDNVTSFVVTKGRQQVQDPFKAGIAIITGRDINEVSSLNIGDTIQIRSTTFNGASYGNIFYAGFIADISVNYGNISNMDTWTIQVEDGLAAAGRAVTSRTITAGSTTIAASQAAALGTNVIVGDPLGVASSSKTSAFSLSNANLLTVLNQLIATEQGRLTSAGGQSVLFYGRNTQNIYGTTCNFTDGTVASALPAIIYQQIIFRSRADSYYTKVVVEPQGLAAQTAGTGDRTFVMQSYDETTAQASDLASYVLNTLDVSQDAPSTLSFISESQTVTEGFTAAFFGDDGTRTVQITLRGVVYTCFIQGVTISADPEQTRFTLNLSSSEAAVGFILDSAVFGVLDTSKLGF